MPIIATSTELLVGGHVAPVRATTVYYVDQVPPYVPMPSPYTPHGTITVHLAGAAALAAGLQAIADAQLRREALAIMGPHED